MATNRPTPPPTPPPAPTPGPLLSLDTLSPPEFLEIDGVAYDFRLPDRLSIVEVHRLQAWCPRFDALCQNSALDAAEEAELKRLLQQISDLVLDAPADVRARLRDHQRLQVVLTFTALSMLGPQLTRAIAETGPASTTTTPSTGASRSPDWSGATPAPLPSAG